MKFCNHDEKPLEKVKAADGGAFKGFTFTTVISRSISDKKEIALTQKLSISDPIFDSW